MPSAATPGSSPSQSRARSGLRLARRLSVATSIALLLVVGACAAAREILHRVTNLDHRLPALIHMVEEQTGLRLQVDRARLSVGSHLAILVRGIRAFAPEGGDPLVEAADLRVILTLKSLFHGHLVFDRIEIRSPTFRLDRDADGRFNFEAPFARFLSYRPLLPDPSRKDGRSARWAPSVVVDSLRVTDGTVIFRDAARVSAPGLELRDLDLAATRYPEAASLRFALSARSVQGGGPPARIEASGLLTNIYAAPAFSSVGARVNLAVHDLDSTRTLASVVAASAVRSCEGTLDLAADYAGTLTGPFTLTAHARFASLVVDAPVGWHSPFRLANGSLRVRIEKKDGAVAFEDLSLASDGVALAGRVALEDLPSGDPILSLSVHTPLLNIPTIEPYFPLKILRAPFWRYITTVVDKGRAGIDTLAGRGRLSQFSRMRERENGSILHAAMRFEGLGGTPGKGFQRLDGLTGRLRLEGGVVHLDDFAGVYHGESRLDRIEGEIEKVYESVPRMTLRVKGEVGLDDLRGTFATPFFPDGVRAVAESVEVAGGRALLRARVATDFGSLVDYDGSLSVSKGGLTVKPWRLKVTALEGGLDVTRERLSTGRMVGRVDGSEVTLSGEVAPYLENAALDLELGTPGIAGAAVYGFLDQKLPEGAAGGQVEGSLRLHGPVAKAADLNLEGALDLDDVPLLWGETRGELPARATGSVKMAGGVTSFNLGKLVYRGVPFRASGTYLPTAQSAGLDIDASSDAEVNLDAMLSPDGARNDNEAQTTRDGSEKGPSEDRRGMRVRGKLTLAKARMSGVPVEDFAADLEYGPGELKLKKVQGKAAGGHFTLLGEARLRGSRAVALDLTPSITGADAGALFELLGAKDAEVTGTASLSGTIRMSGSKKEERLRTLEGAVGVEVTEGTIRRSELLWKVLDFVNLGSWMKRPFDFRLEGLHFSRIRGTVQLSKGVARTEDLKLVGDPVDVDVLGDLDIPRKEVRCVVAVKPFGLVDTVLDQIPIAEQIKNGLELTTYNFAVTGPLSDPRVVPATIGKMDDLLNGLLNGRPAGPPAAVTGGPASPSE